MTDFYAIETPPPSSSTSKDSTDDSLLTKCLPLLSANFQETSMSIRTDETDSSICEDLHPPLRRTLGNTKLKTRQDVRRFRKFLKRQHDLSAISLLDIEPETMRGYLLDYLTSIRTRKGFKYDPETLRSYYLSIQRYLKDSSYSHCLRNSPQFAPCRDLIIQMRKEKNQIKVNNLSPELKRKKKETIDEQLNSSDTYYNRLPSSSLPPRKRQQMKYFLESSFACDFLLLSSSVPPPRPTSSPLSSASRLLLAFLSSSPSAPRSEHFQDLLDRSPACGKEQRLMLSTLCQHWTGDIRLVHANLRPEVNEFLPHILVLNILLSSNAVFEKSQAERKKTSSA